ncbi:MAG: ATP phosphoribosyltransferase regulatory subunit [Alphaproteobacteria bacterium]
MNNFTRNLPLGFYDLENQEAELNHFFTLQCINNFMANGYKLIKTSLMEFENNLNNENEQNHFKILDPVTQKNIVIRNDITAQIAKLITIKKQYQPEFLVNKSIKLCYYGDVINLLSDEFFGERQKTQVGCEIIGSSEIEDFLTILDDTLKSFIKIKNLNISISFPDLAKFIVQKYYPNQKNEILEAIYNKRIYLFNNNENKLNQIIKEIITNNSDLDSNLNLLKTNISDIEEIFLASQKIKEFVQKNYANIKLNFDFFGDNKYSYHNKIIFDIFVDDFRYAIAKGGCYKINCNHDFIDAVGSTIYINYLRKLTN